MEIYLCCCAWKTVWCLRFVPNLVGRPSFSSSIFFLWTGLRLKCPSALARDSMAMRRLQKDFQLSSVLLLGPILPRCHPLPEIPDLRSPVWGIRWNGTPFSKPQTKIFSSAVYVFGKMSIEKIKNKKLERECGLQFVHFICLISIFKFDIFKFCHSSLKERLWNGVDWMLPLSHRLDEIMQTKWLDFMWVRWAHKGRTWMRVASERIGSGEMYFLFQILLPESI